MKTRRTTNSTLFPGASVGATIFRHHFRPPFLVSIILLPLCFGCGQSPGKSDAPPSIDERAQNLPLNELKLLVDTGVQACGGRREWSVLKSAYLLRTLDYSGALAEIDNIDPQGDYRTTALWIAGESLFRSGNLRASLPLLSTLSAEAPDHLRGRRCLAAIYFDMGAMDHAEEQLLNVIRLDPGDCRPHYLLGKIYLDYEYFKKSVTQFQQALKLNPQSARLEIERGLAAAYCGDRTYAEILSWSPENAGDSEIQAFRAEALWSSGRPDEALDLVRTALQANPTNETALLLSARMHIDAGETNHAISQLNQILVGNSHHVVARFQLAMVYRRIGDEERSREHTAKLEESRELTQRLVDLNQQALDRVGDWALYQEIIEVCETLGKKQLADRWRKTAGKPRE